jgi:hypothetical protein
MGVAIGAGRMRNMACQGWRGLCLRGGLVHEFPFFVSFPSFAKASAGTRVFRGWYVSLFAYFVVVVLSPAQSVPDLIHYQGRLTGTDGVPLRTDEYAVELMLKSGTNVLYVEELPTLPVVRGYFSTVIGGNPSSNSPNVSVSGALAGSNVHIQVTCTNPLATTGRQPLLSVPYAMEARNAALVGGTNLLSAFRRFANDEVSHGDANSGFMRIGDLQFCWGQETKNNTSGPVGFHFDFPSAFREPPCLTHAIDTQGGGVATMHGVYSWSISESAFSVSCYTAAGLPPPRSTPVTFRYLAVGRW